MSKWKQKELGQIINLQRGYDLPHSARSEGTYPVVSSSGVTDYHAEFKEKGPGVITGRYGTIGEVFYVEGDYWPHNTTLFVEDFKSNYPRFIYYLLQTLGLDNNNDAGAVPGVNRQSLHAIKTYLPPLPLQRRIAAVLGRYDALLENYQQQVAALEALAQEVYREWFVRGRCPGAAAGSGGELPAGWEVKKVTDCFDITGGGTPSRDEPGFWEDGTVNWFTPTDVTGGKSLFLTESSEKITIRGLQSSGARLFPAYSVMMTSRATIGALSINTQPATTNQGFIVCLPNEHFSCAFIYFWLQQNQATFEMLANGATFLEISKGNFKEIKIIVPGVNELRTFDKVVLPLFKKIENLQNQITILRATRDALLPRLLSGQLAVGEAEAALAG